MRRTSDLAMDLPRRRFSGRGIFIAVGAAFLFVLIFGRAIARFYVDYLWHKALGRGDMFWGVIGAKFTLFVAFFLVFLLIAGLNLFIADRAAPTSFPANVHPYVERFHDVFGHRLRLVRYAGATLFALLLALPAIAQWQSWLLFRNARNFGVADEQFGVDVGFYVFQLPFLAFVLNWLFFALIVVLLLTIADPRAQRRRRLRLADAGGASGDQGPHRRAAGRARHHQGGRLLARSLRGHQQPARHRAGRHLLGREGAAPGDHAVDPDRAADGRSVPVGDQDRIVPAPADRLGAVAGRRHRRRRDLSGGRAVARGEPQPGVARGSRTSNATSWPPDRRSG